MLKPILCGLLCGTAAAFAKPMVQFADVPANASHQDIVNLAANVVPHPRQVTWQEMEFYGFIHFGPNTFNGVEWGNGKEEPRSFAPKQVDTDQWSRLAKAAGMKMLMITVKHHDGYCLWQTRYTDHSVAQSPWMDGKGDVLKELAKSCHKYGLKLGVYLSPADLYQIENEKGLYGNLSKYSERTIPREVPGRPFRNKKKFKYNVDDYNEYFMNQLFELLTEYGPVHEVWFDGAHPKRKGGQVYTYDQWYELIRALAPQAIIAIMGSDARWCGNEHGGTRADEWSVVPQYRTGMTLREKHADRQDQDLGSRERLKGAKELMWWPSEVDTSMRHGWFYRNDHQHVRPVGELLDIWFRSVGGNATYLLNMTPNKEGRIPEKDAAYLVEMGRVLRETFKTNLITGARVKASNTQSRKTQAGYTVDRSVYSFWKPRDGQEQAELQITLPKAQRFDTFMIQEAIGRYGQRIEAFALDAYMGGSWQTIAESGTVGYKRILRFDGIKTNKLRVRILKSRIAPTVSNLGLFLREPVREPQIGHSTGYTFVSSSGWHVANGGSAAVDGDDQTTVERADGELIVDLRKTMKVPGFSYTPRQDSQKKGIVDYYAFYVSEDGKSWKQVKTSERFNNIRNSPVKQVVELDQPVKARYVKLKNLKNTEGGKEAVIAEFGILEATH